jgi:hypothetical protein
MQNYTSLPMYCPHCATRLDVTLSAWNYGSKILTATFTCPACETAVTAGFNGHFEKVARRADPAVKPSGS